MLACSKRSDSGERCEVKKAMKSRGGLGREVLLFFRAPFTSHRSPLSERLEQATPMLNGHFVKRALSWPCLQGGHYVSYLARRKMLG